MRRPADRARAGARTEFAFQTPDPALVVIGAMAMGMYELFAIVEKRTTGWAHRGAHA